MLVTDPLGHPLLEIQEFPTRRPAQGLVKDLARNIKRLLAEHPEFGECLGVGIVVAGLVDLDRGRLRNAPTLGWRDVELQEPLREAIGLPVVVENDVKACVLAQVWAVRGLRAGGRAGRVRERVGRRRRGHRSRRTAAAGSPQQRRRVRPRLAQHGRPAVRLRTEGLLGGVRVGPGHRRSLHRSRPLVARVGRARATSR